MIQTKGKSNQLWMAFVALHLRHYPTANVRNSQKEPIFLYVNGVRTAVQGMLSDHASGPDELVTVELRSTAEGVAHITLMDGHYLSINAPMVNITHHLRDRESFMRIIKGDATPDPEAPMETSLCLIDLFKAEKMPQCGRSMILVDSGASETVGTPQAITDLCEAAAAKGFKTYIHQGKAKPRFRLADGTAREAYSCMAIETPYGKLTAYCLEGEDVPILMSVNTLRALKASIDFETDEMVFTLPVAGKPKRVNRKLHRTPKGHLMFDIMDTNDVTFIDPKDQED